MKNKKISEIIIGSNNGGKIREISALLGNGTGLPCASRIQSGEIFKSIWDSNNQSCRYESFYPQRILQILVVHALFDCTLPQNQDL